MNTFQQTGLSNEILQALQDLGFEKPTSIQEEAIPKLLTSQTDVIAIAQTGTGKTAAFSLPLIDNLDENCDDIQALILCPTRELCLQIKNDIKSFTKYKKKITEIAIYGGADIRGQLRELKQGGQIIVGTPGRVQDFINRKKLDLSNLKYLILDEADEMLNRGFK